MASVYLRLGTVATEAVITAVVPSLADSAQGRILVRPGAPTSLVVTPRDTTIYVNQQYPLQVSLEDQFGNLLPATGVSFGAESSYASVSTTGAVTTRSIGRASVTVKAGAFTASAWLSVVPPGRIAATVLPEVGGDSAYLVLINLDGSARRTVRVNAYDVPMAAWHPSGSYLVASRRAVDASDSVPRLSALDTTALTWRQLPGTPGTMGDGAATFSPDGNWIYVANSPINRYVSSGASAIYRVRADGSGSAEAVGYDAQSSTVFDDPTISPDGMRVALTVDVSLGTFTDIVPASPPLGPAPPELALVGGLPTGGHPHWSPVADTLLMFGTEGMWLMPAGATSVADRRYLAPDWADRTNVTGGFAGASWSADGHWIITRAAAGLILVEVATGRVLPLPFGAHLSYPAWRPR